MPYNVIIPELLWFIGKLLTTFVTSTKLNF